jgi:putative transposase
MAGRLWRFSYGHSQMKQVYDYVMNQKEHHKRRSFQDEYTELLKKFEISFNERYVFQPIE